ncbi:MAG TPA: thiol:disulfide interchange protein DsbA/DsbL [Paucimonas sp.]|nr:thiol:disulfide interchange protein DsbA/DsbL [Paucimonas sp.]
MRFFKRFLAGIALSLLACSPAAFAADPTNGAGYLTLPRPQPTEAAAKVEIVEFFSYHCPHCYTLDPTLNDWVKKRKDDIVFKRVHVAWGEPGSATEKMLSGLQRAFYTLEVMGKGEELHKKIFDAIHAERQALYNEDAIVKFLVKQGIDKQKYLDTANSFTVQSKIQRARQAFASFNLDSVPNIVIDGRFVTSPGLASKGATHLSDQAEGMEALRVMDTLIAKVMAERGKAAKPAAAAASPKK